MTDHTIYSPLLTGFAWVYFVMALAVGTLSGLQAGRGKTLMTAFISAVQGSVKQACVLGVSAAMSQTAVVWLLAFLGFYLFSIPAIQKIDPEFQVLSGLTVMLIASWMVYRTRQAQLQRIRSHGNGPHQGMMFRTDHCWVEITIFRNKVTPRFRIYFYDLNKTRTNPLSPSKIVFKIVRPDGTFQNFDFIRLDEYLEATDFLPEPHEFEAILQFRHSDLGYLYKVRFVEFYEDELPPENDRGLLDVFGRDQLVKIQKNWNGREASTKDVLLFGLASGLLSSPEAFAVLLVSLQFKTAGLGCSMIFVFFVGLAASLMTVGALTAVYSRNVHQIFRDFFDLANKVSYAGSAALMMTGLWVLIDGFSKAK